MKPINPPWHKGYIEAVANQLHARSLPETLRERAKFSAYPIPDQPEFPSLRD